MVAPQFKAVLIATPQMRSESGLTFRSKQSAVWPADPRGRRGGREPAGKTCYLPRFHIMLSLLHLHRRESPVPFKALASCLLSDVPDSRLARAPCLLLYFPAENVQDCRSRALRQQ